MTRGVRIQIRGIVQGVGFRPWVYRLARERGIGGRVLNDSTGVTIDAFGAAAAISSFVDVLRASPPPAAKIVDFVCSDLDSPPVAGFTIVRSEAADERRVSIPADLATCDDCVREIFDPADRRYRYPFTNCTNCGPRFTIALDVPYDRPATTMASFPMCGDCRREYESVDDRRFHAQPNACPACGPRLRIVRQETVPLSPALSGAETQFDVRGEGLGVRGRALPQPFNPSPLAPLPEVTPAHESAAVPGRGETDAIAIAAAALKAGQIVALKGIGGFHLACDATSDDAVARLRERKKRDEKPFAIMVRDLEAAEDIARIDAAERALLTGVERPIVLLRKRDGSEVSDLVAPRNRLVGIMLPYSPLHHLLMADAGRPLVMTSGNLSEEPIAYGNGEAIETLRDVADVFLLHDREIVTRCDDSVARIIAGAPTILRRSRGYVPRALPLGRRIDEPVLACGAHIKNTFAIAHDDVVHLGPHIGDLENLETLESYESAIDRMQRFLGVEPQIVAHDMHPAYVSTEYALLRPSRSRIAVQHHHAHIAGAMAEHRLEGPVLGVAFDGTGYGTDATAWGGELLLADDTGFQRLATLRPVSLAGGDMAIREVWRIALALLDDAYDGNPPLEALPLAFDMRRVGFVRQMIAHEVNVARAHGAGRFFDAFGSIFLGRAVSRYEGQVALEWNLAADEAERGEYPFEEVAGHSEVRLTGRTSECSAASTIDLRPTLRAAIDDFGRGASIGTISARFHSTLAAAAAAMVRRAAEAHGNLPVVLSGGCFQNALLTERLIAFLTPEFRVVTNRQIPPGDGGIAFGQAVIAEAIVRGGSSCV